MNSRVVRKEQSPPIRAMKDTNTGKDQEQRMKALAELNELRKRCAALLPEDFDPEVERAAAMEERYGRIN